MKCHKGACFDYIYIYIYMYIYMCVCVCTIAPLMTSELKMGQKC